MKGKTSLIVVITAIFVVASLIFGACAPKPKAPVAPVVPVAPIKVGTMADWSGPTAAHQTNSGNAIIDYIRMINDKGGIKGVPIAISWLDHKNEVPLAISHYKRLKDEGIVLLVGVGTAIQLPVSALTAEDKIPHVLSVSVGPALWPDPKYNFGCQPTWTDIMGAAIDFVAATWKEKRAPRMGYLGADISYGKSPLAGETKKYAAEKGVDWVATEIFSPSALDMSAELMRLRAANVDVMVTSAIFPEQMSMMKNYVGLKLTAPLIHLIPPDVKAIEKNPEIFEGAYYVLPLYQPFEDVPEVKEVKAIYSKYRTVGEADSNYHIGWLAVTIAVEGMQLAMDKVGREKLTGEAIYTHGLGRIKDFNTRIAGKVTYVLGVDQSGVHDYRVFQVKAGKFILVKDWWYVRSMKG